MASIDEIVAGFDRDVVMEAMYLAAHEVTCSARLSLEIVLKNGALNAAQAKQAMQLAERILAIVTGPKGKEVDELTDSERRELLRKLRGYQRRHLIDVTEELLDQARQKLGQVAA
jgi:hypothetical protein